MDVEIALKLCVEAIEQNLEDRLFNQWLVQLPYMALKQLEYISYENYRDKMTLKNVDMRSDAEIIAEIEALHSRNGEK